VGCRRAIERGDRGESLIEILVAITILSVCVIAIGSGIVTSIKISGIHRSQAVAQDYLHNYAETLQGTAYQPCASSYGSVATAVGTPANFSDPVIAVSYWNVSLARFTAACSIVSDSGLQQVTFRLTSSDRTVSESLTATIRSSS
jgi:type II secretory pathway pseudopilin PulG